jgi:predicted phage terminase large subunit-like protein
MGRFPGLRVLMTSYASTPIVRAAKRARQLCASPAFGSIFPLAGGPGEVHVRLMKDSSAAHEWELTNGSGLFAAGIMAGITSSRCDVGIVDDPVAGRAEADSETVRRTTKQAYQDDFLTRLKPKASIILMQTRWHEDDLVGSILPEDYDGRSGMVKCRDGQVWEVLNIQAKNERLDDPVGRAIGEYLWPEWFDRQHWAMYEALPRTWNALYQQKPTLEVGGQFEETDFKRYDKKPKHCTWLVAGDFAVTKLTQGENPDFTEIIAAGIDEDGDLWLDHGYYGQEATDKTVDAYLDLAVAYKANLLGMEKGVIKNAIEPQLERRMKERARKEPRVMVPLHFTTSTGDKIAKVSSFRGRAKLGKVHVRSGPWGDRLIAQLVAFPFARNDDGVDACGVIGAMIDDVFARQRKKKPPRDTLEPFTEKWLMAADERDARERREREDYLA